MRCASPPLSLTLRPLFSSGALVPPGRHASFYRLSPAANALCCNRSRGVSENAEPRGSMAPGCLNSVLKGGKLAGAGGNDRGIRVDIAVNGAPAVKKNGAGVYSPKGPR
jgi:hypothetical protein